MLLLNQLWLTKVRNSQNGYFPGIPRVFPDFWAIPLNAWKRRFGNLGKSRDNWHFQDARFPRIYISGKINTRCFVSPYIIICWLRPHHAQSAHCTRLSHSTWKLCLLMGTNHYLVLFNFIPFVTRYMPKSKNQNCENTENRPLFGKLLNFVPSRTMMSIFLPYRLFTDPDTNPGQRPGVSTSML